jgi:hypothetical protein
MHYNHSLEAMRSSNPGRIAIWNKAKIIFGIAMGIWIVDNALFIYGKYPLRFIGKSSVYLMWYHITVAVSRVNFLISTFGPARLTVPDDRSSALRGRLKQAPAACSTLIAVHLLLSAHSFLTLHYLSSCSSACSACAAEEALPLPWGAPSGSRCGVGSSRWSWYS